MCMMLADFITQNQLEVVGEAHNGIEAMAAFRRLCPDLVVMDIAMPMMDGLRALKTIKTFDAEARVLICSSMGQDALVKEAIESGAAGFVVKPFEPECLRRALAQALR